MIKQWKKHGTNSFQVLVISDKLAIGRVIGNSRQYYSFMTRSLILLAISLLTVAVCLPPQTPIIGIFTLENEDTSFGSSTYIAASYVKFIEMSGAQVVPIMSYSPTADILKLVSQLNGVLFTGGSGQIDIKNLWTRNAEAILNYAKEQNDKGNVFPVWGTCMGFQLLSYLTADDKDVLSRVTGDVHVVKPINITASNSAIFNGISSYQKEKITRGNGIFFFSHNWAVTMNTFNTNKYLKNFWNLIAQATTPTNIDFVAAVEAKNYPFYGVQFHPEKNMFEWKISADRSIEGVEVVQIMSNNFVEKARANKNSFSNDGDFQKLSIYNYQTHPTSQMSFSQIYVFPEKPHSSTLRYEA